MRGFPLPPAIPRDELHLGSGFVSEGTLEAAMRFMTIAYQEKFSYASGFNSIPVRRTQAILDARQTYPSTNSTISPASSLTPFNDTSTVVFGSHTSGSSPVHQQTMMYPEMIPALQFSGSGDFSTTVPPYSYTPSTAGETRQQVLRDVSRTPFNARLTAPGIVRPGTEHQPTLELNKWNTANNTTSQNTEVLGGVIAPFDDSALPTDAAVIDKVAVNPSVYPGLDQKLGDHIAIVIDLNPSEDTTIGINPNENLHAKGVHRTNSSIAYFNFTSNKWEKQGKASMPWVIPGVSGSSNAPGAMSIGKDFPYSINWDSSLSNYVSGSPGSWPNQNAGRGRIHGASGQNRTGNPLYVSQSYSRAFFGEPGLTQWNRIHMPGPQFGGSKDQGLVDDNPLAREGWSPDPSYPTLIPLANIAYPFYTNYSRSFIGLMASSSMAFAATSGFTIYPDSGENALDELKNLARPTALNGFPYDDRWEATDGQTLDMSKYIDGPFLLERFAVHFDAEIEDSGPASLGYKLHRNRQKSFCGIFDDTTPAIADSTERAVPDALTGPNASTGASSWDMTNYPAGFGAGTADGQVAGRLTLNRGHFLGGNAMHEFNRGTSDLGQDQEVYEDSASTPNEKQVICRVKAQPQRAFGARTVSDDPQNPLVAYDRYTGAAGGIRFPGSPSGGQGGGNHTWGPAGAAKCFQATPGVFLPVAGPDNTPTVYGASAKARGGYVPVLITSINGVVTGSQYALQKTVPGLGASARYMVPYMPVPTHGFDSGQGCKDYGAPFWRCDTFFLMRQEKISRPITHYAPVEFKGEQRLPMVENRDYSRGATVNSAIASTTQRKWQSQIWGPNQGSLAAGMSNFAAKVFTSDNRGYIDGMTLASNDSTLGGSRINFLTSSATKTIRELITYGQMVHYGHTTAPTNLIISKSDGTNAALHFTQAVKYANTGSTSKSGAIWVSDNGDHNINGALSMGRGALAGKFCAGSNFPGDAVASGETSGGGLPSYPLLPRGSFMGLDTAGEEIPGHTSLFYDRVEVWPGRSSVHAPCMPSFAGDHTDWDRYGNFDRGGLVTGSVPLYESGSAVSNQWGLGAFEKSGKDYTFKTVNWMDAGLARDLNIRITPGMTHGSAKTQSGQAYVTSSLCSFTILTASTVHRPLARTGSWSADLPVVANVFERRLLNAGHFQLEAPVRTSVNMDQGPLHNWALTIPNGEPMWNSLNPVNIDYYRTKRLGVAAGGSINDTPGDWYSEGYSNAGSTNTMHSKPIVDAMMVRSGSFMPINAAPPTLARIYGQLLSPASARFDPSAGGQYSGPSPATGPSRHDDMASKNPGAGWVDLFNDGMPSSRRFVKGIVGSKPLLLSLPRAQPAPGIKQNPFATDYRNHFLPPGAFAATYFHDASEENLVISSSVESTQAEESLYVLMPGDKLVLGLQPSIHGGNPGANLPTNVNVAKWGPYDYDESTTAAAVKAMTTSSINMETPYEPARAMTMKAMRSGGKLILYGTLLRDNKHQPSQLQQNLTNNYVHQAIGNNPVTDQFLIASRRELRNGYLDMHYAGSISAIVSSSVGGGVWKPSTTTAEMIRGMKVRSGRSLFMSQSADLSPVLCANLHISASIQRFVSLEDKGETYYDSLGLDLGDIFVADGLARFGGTSAGSLVGYFCFTKQDTLGTPDLGLAANTFWMKSFPFENRYKEVTRLISRDASMGSWGIVSSSNNDVRANIRLHNPWDNAFHADSVSAVETANSDEYKILAAAVFGFGKRNTHFASGSLHTKRIKYTNAENSWHHPHGVKYGMINYDHQNTKSIFRPDKYGQLRDQLEQRKYSKFYSKVSFNAGFGLANSSTGEGEAAVSCIFVDGEGSPLEDGTSTSCQNISMFMTSSVPYKEGETPARNPIINEQLVTISSLVDSSLFSR